MLFLQEIVNIVAELLYIFPGKIRSFDWTNKSEKQTLLQGTDSEPVQHTRVKT